MLIVSCGYVCAHVYTCMDYVTFFIIHSDDDTENLEDEEYFYIDILHGGLIRSKNDCPVTRGRRCPIENFNEPNKITPTEVSNLKINSKNISK